MENRTDRRVKMTKKIFHETIIELLQNSHISELSIKQICEEADLNRSTFYAHYQSPMELYQEVEKEAYEALTEHLHKGNFKDADSKAYDSIWHTLEFVKKNPKLSKVLLGENGRARFKEFSVSIARDYFYNKIRCDKRKKHYILHYYSSGWITIMEEWLNGNCVEETHEICELVVKLCRYPV